MTPFEILLWAVKIVTAVLFLIAGTAKLRGHPFLIDVFARVGLGQWFRIFTGIVEVTSAVALLYPPTAGIAALILACTMACALIVDILVVHINPLPGILLFVASSFILWCHRESLAQPLTTLGIVAG